MFRFDAVALRPSRWALLTLAATFFCQNIRADAVQYYAGVSNCDSSGCTSPFNLNQGFATASNDFQTAPGNVYRDEKTASTANLQLGQLHAASSGYVLSSATDGTQFTTVSQAFLGDTITASGAGVSGGNLTATIQIHGSMSILPNTAASTWTNYSFVEIYFDPLGTFGASKPPLAAYFWGLGPNASSSAPPNATYMGDLSDLSHPISIPVTVPFSLVGSQFQLAIGMGADITGNSTGGISWNLNLGDTLTTSLSTTPGVQLSSVGGFAGLPATGIATPEPAMLAPVLTGIAALFAGVMLRRRRTVRG